MINWLKRLFKKRDRLDTSLLYKPLAERMTVFHVRNATNNKGALK